MKKVIGLLMLLVSFTAYGQQYDKEKDFKVEKSSDGKSVVIVGYLGKNTTINIPPQIQKMPVIGIGSNVFQEKRLISVTIPNSVTTIGNGAFSYNRLRNLTIPNSVTTLGDYAFFKNVLTSITIGNNVKSIGESTFADNQLISVTIPDSVTSIGGGAFYNNQLTSVTIGNGVTFLGPRAFSDNQLISVTIGNSVTSIGGGAFMNNKLTSIIIPNSVTSIGDDAFYNNQLTSVTIPDNVTFGDRVFAENPKITYTPMSAREKEAETKFNPNKLDRTQYREMKVEDFSFDMVAGKLTAGTKVAFEAKFLTKPTGLKYQFENVNLLITLSTTHNFVRDMPDNCFGSKILSWGVENQKSIKVFVTVKRPGQSGECSVDIIDW